MIECKKKMKVLMRQEPAKMYFNKPVDWERLRLPKCACGAPSTYASTRACVFHPSLHLGCAVTRL